MDLHFPKDFKGGDSIRDGWVEDMTHFVNHFEAPKGKFATEELLIYKIDEDHYIQGYADLIRYDEEGQSILDWKTSSLYTGDDLLHHGRQLVIYALAKEQQGIKINELAWIFLKYVEVSFMGKKRSNSKNKSEITKIINRRKIAETLERYIRNDLEEVGYDEITIESLIYQVNEKNSLDCLPDEIQNNYHFKPCVVTYKLTDDVREETLEYINRTISSFEERGNNEDEWEPRKFTKLTKSGKEVEDTFFCNFLCNHRKTCRYIIEHQGQILNSDDVLEGLL